MVFLTKGRLPLTPKRSVRGKPIYFEIPRVGGTVLRLLGEERREKPEKEKKIQRRGFDENTFHFFE